MHSVLRVATLLQNRCPAYPAGTFLSLWLPLEGAVERSATESGLHHIGLPDVGDQREGVRFFIDAVGHFPSFWELSLRKKPHASVGPDPRFYGNRMWDFFSHTRPQNRKVQPPAEVKECATVLAGVRSSPCPVS